MCVCVCVYEKYFFIFHRFKILVQLMKAELPKRFKYIS